MLSSAESRSKIGDSGQSCRTVQIQHFLVCRHNSIKVAHTSLLWRKHHLGLLCGGGGGIFLAGGMQRGGRSDRLCRDTLKSMVKAMCWVWLLGHAYSTATAKQGQGVGCGFRVGW